MVLNATFNNISLIEEELTMQRQKENRQKDKQ
jgi:hypothetical protein